jgi:hypothetical protein
VNFKKQQTWCTGNWNSSWQWSVFARSVVRCRCLDELWKPHGIHTLEVWDTRGCHRSLIEMWRQQGHRYKYCYGGTTVVWWIHSLGQHFDSLKPWLITVVGQSTRMPRIYLLFCCWHPTEYPSWSNIWGCHRGTKELLWRLPCSGCMSVTAHCEDPALSQSP